MLLRLTPLLILLLAFVLTKQAIPQEAGLPPRPSSAYRGQVFQRPLQKASFSLSDDEPSAPEAAPPAAPEMPPAAGQAPLKLAPRVKSPAKEVSRPATPSPTNTVTTVGGSLAIVLGLFALLAWFSRRFTPAGAAALPKEAVELLGRTSLGGTHQVQLMRIGAKLLLVALSPQGARTLTEINNLNEVERLSDLCRRQKPESATASFRSLVEQVGGERTANTFVDSPRRTPAAATAAPRGRAAARV
jgi:flagellar biogenesis protein FliO